MADYIPLFPDASAITYTAKTAVIGGRLVEVAGDRQISHAAASSTKTVGIAGQDAAEGETVTVYSEGIQRPIAAQKVSAGDRVSAAADGKVAPGGTPEIGTALTAAAAGSIVQIKLDH